MSPQQQPGSSPENVMPQPPQTVTVKDHLYLSDMLSWNLTAAKKAAFFAKQCMDMEVKKELEKTAQMHERHYQQLLTHLQPAAQPGPGAN
ncbi:hypothetical protein [Salibacterium qingdaonense]|uniref:Coat F domain-containing protein n=1 Tax=Salibacterium qingdaonense TaxID=266892 RepID=A0A1I4LXN4_9BACI|nr:hypothetical protein [Salibacterium qingdaonense]SFL95669.1 hypothetical protein SAMN04488054_10954 [Salibacterium qingdaonense]